MRSPNFRFRLARAGLGLALAALLPTASQAGDSYPDADLPALLRLGDTALPMTAADYLALPHPIPQIYYVEGLQDAFAHAARIYGIGKGVERCARPFEGPDSMFNYETFLMYPEYWDIEAREIPLSEQNAAEGFADYVRAGCGQLDGIDVP